MPVCRPLLAVIVIVIGVAASFSAARPVVGNPLPSAVSGPAGARTSSGDEPDSRRTSSQPTNGQHGTGRQTYLNLMAFGQLLIWPGDRADRPVEIQSLAQVPRDPHAVGIRWDDPRDVREVRVRYASPNLPASVRVEYWSATWPPKPPTMPVVEDVIDDPWQGTWRAARTDRRDRGSTRVLTFKPLTKAENRWADHLPGVTYRRTLKLRLVLPKGSPKIESLAIHSDSTVEPLSVRIELGQGEAGSWTSSVRVFNGRLIATRPWQEKGLARGLIADLLASRPAPPGSNDMTVVTVHARSPVAGHGRQRTFSFSTLDLDRGPINVPDLHARVTRTGMPAASHADRSAHGVKIRARIPREPEQTYARAAREIPNQDPWHRQHGDIVYLVLAADASWQKFAVGYDGNIWLNKRACKAFGRERARLKWPGDALHFDIGTGTPPSYRGDHRATMAVLDDDLPVTLNRWQAGGLMYEQEAFATLLSGPLDPGNPRRSEQTPAVLMVRLRATNPGNTNRSGRLSLRIGPRGAKAAVETIAISGHRVLAIGHARGVYDPPLLRAVIEPPRGAPVEVNNGLPTCQYTVPAGGAREVILKIPFVSDVAGAGATALEALQYDRQRARIVHYWRKIVNRTCRFTTPEPKFNDLARAVIPHVHIGVTKCPKSGLYMVPAASMWYRVFANEACFQALMLDGLGDTKRAGAYLDTFVRLQGSKPLLGNYEPPQDGVYHGTKVDDQYDYTAQNYNLDQGTVLWALGRHYFFTRDKSWLEARLPSMWKAVDWIERQRRFTRREDVWGQRVPEFGLLPAGHLEDNADWGYWFSVNAYCVAGMVEMAKALKEIGDPDARRLAGEAEGYRRDLRTAVTRAIEAAPVVRMRDGTYSPYVPPRARQRFRQFGPLQGRFYSRYGKPTNVLPCFRLSGTREVLYGPMILLDLGILDPNDAMADWILDDWEDNLTLSGADEPFNVHGFTDEALWFSQGGMVWQSNLQNPILVYLRRNETPAAIRNLYNNFVACLYQDVNVFTEEYRMWGHGSGPFYKSPDESRFVNRLRDMLVLEVGNDLWLACGAPRRWLASGDGIRVDSINSYFGPVRFTLRAGTNSHTVVAHVEPPTRVRPENLWLYTRLPGHAAIAGVTINGKPWRAIDRTKERIRLPQDGPMDLVIRY